MNSRWLGAVLLVTAAGSAKAADAGTPKHPEENVACLECHGDETQDMELENGEIYKLYTDKKELAKSVHYDLDCTECHTEFQGQGDKHKEHGYPTPRDFTIKYSEQCKECHFKNYTKSLDGVHAKSLAKGEKKDAAVCVDCHGSHGIGKAAEPRSRIAKACARCHEKEAKLYAKSVHGAALMEKENPDVPTCADCHRAHDILDPKAIATRLDSPQMCGTCHTDEKMMAKYKLSTGVLSSYLSDFHGATTVLQKGDKTVQPVVALCVDCHGIHDITKVDDPNSKVIQANLVKTCQKCHQEATDNFPTAWLSHYEPSFSKAPLVYAVKLLYAVLIPFMIGSLVLQIALHLWRVVVNR
jgi:predicted CXXCH cytochrome family protein